jgi:hypothetical protein
LIFCFTTLLLNDLCDFALCLLFSVFHMLHFFNLYPCSMILQLDNGAVALLLKAIEEEGLEICTEGMQKHRIVDEYVHA